MQPEQLAGVEESLSRQNGCASFSSHHGGHPCHHVGCLCDSGSHLEDHLDEAGSSVDRLESEGGLDKAAADIRRSDRKEH